MNPPTLSYLTSQQLWDAALTHLLTLPANSPELSHAYANWTALHHASSASPTPTILHALLKHGADPHATGPAGSTPLHLAAWHGTSAVGELLAYGADGGAKTEAGRTPLHFAARQGHCGVVRALLEGGCKDVEDVHGVSAREMAGREGLEGVVAVFEEFENGGKGNGKGEKREREDGGEGERGIGEGVRKRVRSFVETVGTEVVVAGGVGFLLGALVPRKG